MTDFTTDGLLYPLTKGDLLGHIFHGNQYSKGVAEHVNAGEKAERMGVYRFHNGRWQQAKELHEEAVKHFTAARDLEKANGGSKADELDARVKVNQQRAETAEQMVRAKAMTDQMRTEYAQTGEVHYPTQGQ